MAKKTKTITLAYIESMMPEPFRGKPAWRVIKVTDSTDYSPEQLLKKTEVDDLCGYSDWKVTIQKSGA
jgi:hypothetical protein